MNRRGLKLGAAEAARLELRDIITFPLCLMLAREGQIGVANGPLNGDVVACLVLKTGPVLSVKAPVRAVN